MTKFSFEVPLAHMNDFEDLQDFHFALSFLFQKTLSYRRFFERQIQKGLKTIWLDNSWNEQQRADDAHSLGRLARTLNCHKVISPDAAEWDTLQLYNAYHDLIKYIPSTKAIMVATRKEIIDVGESIGATHFAIPYRNRTPVENWMKQHHFLGMNSVKELQEFQPPSCDTGMPIKMAMEGMALHEWEARGCPHFNNCDKKFKNYFDAKLDDTTLRLAIQNIIDLKGAVNGKA